MRIGIELNNIVRDINTQIIKYYKKDINKDFDDSNIDLESSEIITKLPFKSKKERDNFIYVDYAYEIFGCAKTMGRNIVNSITDFEIMLNNLDDGEKYEIIHFSLLEIALTIQSTFYFLSKVGSRVRKVIFPKKGSDIWNECDVVITTNKYIIKNKPSNNKVSVLIKTSDNKNVESFADLVYDDIISLINDKTFIKKVKKIVEKKKYTIFNKFKNKIEKIFK